LIHFNEQVLSNFDAQVLDPNMTLQEAHDISEPLQIKLERLPYVERAFVHCDWKLDGDEHVKKH
jgi:divalent metal cation (Fe/Co/Zn/Cd) transporter